MKGYCSQSFSLQYLFVLSAVSLYNFFFQGCDCHSQVHVHCLYRVLIVSDKYNLLLPAAVLLHV